MCVCIYNLYNLIRTLNTHAGFETLFMKQYLTTTLRRRSYPMTHRYYVIY